MNIIKFPSKTVASDQQQKWNTSISNRKRFRREFHLAKIPSPMLKKNMQHYHSNSDGSIVFPSIFFCSFPWNGVCLCAFASIATHDPIRYVYEHWAYIFGSFFLFFSFHPIFGGPGTLPSISTSYHLLFI